MRWRRLPLLFLKAGREFLDDDCVHMAAAVAYYALFSIFPLTLALVSLIGFFLNDAELEQRLVNEVGDFLPVSQELIVETVRGVVAARGATGVIALAGLLWSASGIFSALTRSLNQVWDVPSTRPLWRQKLTELAMFAWIGLLLLASITIATVVALIRRFEFPLWIEMLRAGGWLIDLGLALAPLFLTFATLMALYHVVPHVAVRWNDLWLGAAVAASGLEAAKHLFVWYVGSFASYNAIYGPLSAVVAFLAWVHISMNIVLFGAEIASEHPKVMG